MSSIKNTMSKNFILQSFSLVFKDPLFIFLGASVSLNILALYYFLFFRVTTLSVFFNSNSAFYVWASLLSTIFIGFFAGIAISLAVWQWRIQKTKNMAGGANSLAGSFLGALSVGCPTCGAFLPALLGISGGLAAFPFQGLEIKTISLGLLAFSIISLTKAISKNYSNSCEVVKKENLFSFADQRAVFNINRQTIKPFLPFLAGIFLLVLVVYFPAIGNKFNFGFSFQKKILASVSGNSSSVNSASSLKADDIIQKINPSQGYSFNVSFGNIGPKLLEIGAIDFEKMKKLYKDSGAPLTQEQIKILTEGSPEKIKITSENSYFLLNFFWALGLTNKNPVLDEGPISKYGKDKIGNFASTGGWTLGKKKAAELFSSFEIIKLNSEQQKILEDFAYNSFRPCCSNPTGFPDCNHGMAALALGELMVSQGATADEIFEAFKYFNSFWFPQTYFDIATYFQVKEEKDWSQVDNRLVAGADYSTPQGWQRVRQWLSSNGYLEEAPSSGGGCGV